MVLASFSASGVVRPHIGSGSGRETFCAGTPDSQCPASLPTQQGIVLDLFTEAIATGTSVAMNDKAIVNATRRLAMIRPLGTICL